MNDPCINKQCGAYEKDGEYNCNHVLLEGCPTTCRVYIPDNQNLVKGGDMTPQENDVYQDKYGNNYIAFLLNGEISFVGRNGNYHKFNEGWKRVIPSCGECK